MALHVVHGVQICKSEDKLTAFGGTNLVIMPWDIDEGTLLAIGYSYLLPSRN